MHPAFLPCNNAHVKGKTCLCQLSGIQCHCGCSTSAPRIRNVWSLSFFALKVRSKKPPGISDFPSDFQPCTTVSWKLPPTISLTEGALSCPQPIHHCLQRETTHVMMEHTRVWAAGVCVCVSKGGSCVISFILSGQDMINWLNDWIYYSQTVTTASSVLHMFTRLSTASSRISWTLGMGRNSSPGSAQLELNIPASGSPINTSYAALLAETTYRRTLEQHCPVEKPIRGHKGELWDLMFGFPVGRSVWTGWRWWCKPLMFSPQSSGKKPAEPVRNSLCYNSVCVCVWATYLTGCCRKNIRNIHQNSQTQMEIRSGVFVWHGMNSPQKRDTGVFYVCVTGQDAETESRLQLVLKSPPSQISVFDCGAPAGQISQASCVCGFPSCRFQGISFSPPVR